MSRSRVFLATLAFVAFFAVSAGTATADDSHFCTVKVGGIPDGCKGKIAVYTPHGINYYVNGDVFKTHKYYPIQWAAVVGKFWSPWFYDKVCNDGLNVSRGFCTFQITGIPDKFPARIGIKGLDGEIKAGGSVCLPLYTCFWYQARVREVNGPWLAGKVTCNALNVSKDFCLFTVKGIPESRCGGVVDIWNLVGDLKNTQVFYAPNKAVLKARVRVPAQGSQPGLGIPGPWFPVYVCCNGDLNVAKKFAKVTFKAAWTDSPQQITAVLRDLDIAFGNGNFWCFPKYGKVYVRPGLGQYFSIWFCKTFYEDTTVIWKVTCLTKPTKQPE
jgi:hypothetical protein